MNLDFLRKQLSIKINLSIAKHCVLVSSRALFRWLCICCSLLYFCIFLMYLLYWKRDMNEKKNTLRREKERKMLNVSKWKAQLHLKDQLRIKLIDMSAKHISVIDTVSCGIRSSNHGYPYPKYWITGHEAVISVGFTHPPPLTNARQCLQNKSVSLAAQILS